MIQLRFSIFFVNIMLLGSIAGAQTNPPDPNKMGLDPTVEIITDYQGKILDADKIDVPYSDDNLLSMKSSFTYQVLPLTLSNEFNMRPIPPAGLHLQTEDKKSETGYFRGGLGYPITPDLNLYLHGQFLEHSAVNLYINHQSFWGKVPMYKETPHTNTPLPSEILGDNAKTRAGVTLQHFWKKNAIDIKVEYRNRYVIYHGQDTLLLKQNAETNYINLISNNEYIRDNLSQIFHTIKSTFNFYSFADKNRNTNFNIGGLYEYINKTSQTNSPSVSQSLLGLDLQLNQKTSTRQAIDLSLSTRACNSYADNSLSNVVMNFVPAYQYNSARVSFTAGVNLESVYNNDKFAVNVYPKVNFSYKIIGTYFTPYLSANGGTTINNYEKIIDENPYILPDLNVVNTRTLDLNGGIKGSISSHLAYQLNVGYTIIDSAYFYTNSVKHFFQDFVIDDHDPLRSNFDVCYDNIRRLSFELGLNTEIENFEALVKAKYSQYDMSNAESKPWHLPDIEVGLNLRYTVLDKLIFNVSGRYQGETPVWLNSTDDPKSSTMIPSYINLGAMVEYRIDERVSIYMQGTNLLNDNYQQYYLYYNPGITFGAGLSIVF